GMYAVYHGPDGLTYIATKIHQQAVALAKALQTLGLAQLNSAYFDTLQLAVEDSAKVREIAEAAGINFNYIDSGKLSISLNEATTEADMERLVGVFSQYVGGPEKIIWEGGTQDTAIPQALGRQTSFMEHPVFNSYHSETELMRYIKKLERKDLALNHSMISLGICTMKLNAATEMFPLSSPQWANIHPFVPLHQAGTYQHIRTALRITLSNIPGVTASSLQLNEEAQVEDAGLIVIRDYHESRGERHRSICLIPASAHGTNPAPAVMAGMKVVITET